MWRLPVCVVLMVLAGPAFAEVCDKVRPDWDPSNGPVNQFQELSFFFSGTPGLILVALCFLAFFIKRTWGSIVVALILVAVAILIAADWLWPLDGVTYGAHLEGCTANPLITRLMLVALIVMVAVFGKPRKP